MSELVDWLDKNQTSYINQGINGVLNLVFKILCSNWYQSDLMMETIIKSDVFYELIWKLKADATN